MPGRDRRTARDIACHRTHVGPGRHCRRRNQLEGIDPGRIHLEQRQTPVAVHSDQPAGSRRLVRRWVDRLSRFDWFFGASFARTCLLPLTIRRIHVGRRIRHTLVGRLLV